MAETFSLYSFKEESMISFGPVLVPPLRSDAMEYIEYKDESFPFAIWDDDYNCLANGELPSHWHQSFEIAWV